MGNFDEALEHQNKAMGLAPKDFWIYLNRGITYAAQKRYDSALDDFAHALSLNPNLAEGWSNRGTLLIELQRYDEALLCADKAIEIRENYPVAWLNRGSALKELKRYAEAIASFDKAITLNPDYPEAWYNRGTTLEELERFEEALTCFDKAIALNPKYSEAWTNRGHTFNNLIRFQDALSCYQRAVASNQENAQAHFNESITRLLTGDLSEGWKKYGWRWKVGMYCDLPSFNAPIWNGQLLTGVILAWGEQGLGDQILHLSMIRELITFTNQTVIGVEHRLIDLVQRSFPEAQVVDKNKLDSSDKFSAWIPLGDLGGYFRKTWSDFPNNRASYLEADPIIAASLRIKLTQFKPVVCGISWLSKNSTIGSNKSLNLLELLEILQIPGIEFVDLQYGNTLQERQALETREQIHITRLEEIDNTDDIDGLAALIQACDVVVTISNTTTHLAGALGKPVLLMLPYSRGRHWYWHEDRDDSPWYPGIKIFRQPQQGDWSSVISGVAQEIRNRFIKHDK